MEAEDVLDMEALKQTKSIHLLKMKCMATLSTEQIESLFDDSGIELSNSRNAIAASKRQVSLYANNTDEFSKARGIQAQERLQMLKDTYKLIQNRYSKLGTELQFRYALFEIPRISERRNRLRMKSQPPSDNSPQ